MLSEEFSKYVDLLKSCKSYQLMTRLDGLHGAIGLCTEGAGILDLFKKGIFYEKDIPQTVILEELGDALHYIQMICNECGFKLEDLIKTNMAKLQIRYPDGYSNIAAVHRDKVAEQKVFTNSIDLINNR